MKRRISDWILIGCALALMLGKLRIRSRPVFCHRQPCPGHRPRAAPGRPRRAKAASFDPDRATEDYLPAPRDQRAKSDAYFEGGYWLTPLVFLTGLVVPGSS